MDLALTEVVLDPETDQLLASRVDQQGRPRPAVPVASSRGWTVAAGAFAAAVLVLAVVLRFWTTSQLWLDEALSVNIARLPLGAIPAALRHDGSPPFYYFLLHFWMRAFGTSNGAVRALSGLLSVATLAAIFSAARLHGRRSAAWAATLVLASSPFAVRYATETRMYALMMLLVTLGYIALTKVLERPTPARVLGLAGVASLMLYTHYWTFYLLAPVAGILVVRAVRGRDKPALWGLAALAVAGFSFLPWLASFAFQLRHTGTPWALPPALAAPFTIVFDWAGGGADAAQVLGFSLAVLAVLGLFGAGVDARHIELDLRTRTPARWLALVSFSTLALAVLAARAGSSAFVSRYSAAIYPLFVLLVAQGVGAVLHPKARRMLLGAAVILGLIGGLAGTGLHRTQAGRVAAALNAHAAPGDLIVYCPDQLGPAVSRLLSVHVTALTFPQGASPTRVNWVDYAQHNKAGRVNPFASQLVQRAGSHAIWLVWQGGYRTLGNKCENLARRLAVLRPARTWFQHSSLHYYERSNLLRYPA